MNREVKVEFKLYESVYYSHFDGSFSSNVCYVTCGHGTDCHAESPPGRVQCFEVAKIDPVSPFYPTVWMKKATL